MLAPPPRAPSRRWPGAAAAVALLAAVAVGGATGALSPEQVAAQFVAAVDGGDATAVRELLDEDPTIVTWLPPLPRGALGTTMALLDVGRADDVVVAEAFAVGDYVAWSQALATDTQLLGCESALPDRASQRRIYDLWVECRFASTNALLDEVTDRSAVLRGDVRFGIADGRLRAVLVHAQPTDDLEAVWDFMHWVWETHPADFERWLRGRFQDPVLSSESAHALRELASRYAAEGAAPG